MYDFQPYFTKDGSVGLYSQKDDDIYHSSYGALSEAYEKFILPANINKFLKLNSQIKLLDICFGIGYNTKSFLNYLISIAAIDTDNITAESKFRFLQKINSKRKNRNGSRDCIDSIDTDNIPKESLKKIQIDLIDNDETLIALSPFMALGKLGGVSDLQIKNMQIKNEKIEKILKNKKDIKCPSPIINKEVQIILYQKLVKNNPSLFHSKNAQEILAKNEYRAFFDKSILNLLNLDKIWPLKHTLKGKITTFLHNIYYRYLSPSYKRASIILQNCNIEITPHVKDARIAIQQLDNTYNFIFLDAFTPVKCPCLWSVDFFKQLYNRLEPSGMILTYSIWFVVKSAFIHAGFYVGKIKSPTSGKFTGTIAVKNNDLIETPLSDYDLGLINSRAGICYKDINLNLDNEMIIKNRELEILSSDKISSSQFIKAYAKAD